jgi:hypothetical protein
MERFRLAHRQFMTQLQAAHEELLNSLAPLYPSAELNAQLRAERDRQGRRLALYGLLIEDPMAPTNAIWSAYQHHLESRKAPPREPRTPVQERSRLRWQRIVDAAVSRLKTGEVVDTTDICKALGLPIGTLYQFFPSTDALIDKGYEVLFESLLGSDPSDELAKDPDNE